MTPTKLTFWDIKKGVIYQKDTTCYSLDLLDDKSEEDFQNVSEYLNAICEFMKPVLVEQYFDVGRLPQTIAWHTFAVNLTHMTDMTLIFT